MQKVHNRLHHAVMQKQAYLVLLSSELMHSEGDTSEDDQRVMQDCAYLTTVSALDREEHTQATLMHIIDREKEAVKMFGVPISETQQHIERIDRQIQDANFRFQRSEAKRQVYEAEARKWGEALSSLQKRRSEGVSRMLESYSDQQLLLTHFQREGEARQQLISEKAKAQSLLALEYELEIKLGTLHIEFKKKAEKLRRIESQNLGKVDSFKGSTDMNEDAYVYMINYWLHLNANSKHLEESSEQLLKEIENRNQERDSLKQTLTGLMETGDTADNTMQISNIEELLSYRAKDVEIKEINLAPLQRLQIAALNALSRVLFKVSEAVGEYNTMEQVEDQIEYCAQHLEKMLEEIIKASNLQRSDENLA